MQIVCDDFSHTDCALCLCRCDFNSLDTRRNDIRVVGKEGVGPCAGFTWHRADTSDGSKLADFLTSGASQRVFHCMYRIARLT
jgi:hypothetical protein